MIKRMIILALVIMVFQAFFPLHPLKMSVSDLTVREDKIILKSKVFADDLKASLGVFNKKSIEFNVSSFTKENQNYVKIYLKDKIKIFINGKALPIQIIKLTYQEGVADNDVVLVEYQSLDNISEVTIKKIAVQNDVFFEMIPEQKNIVNIHLKNEKKILMFENESEDTVQEVKY